MTLTTDIKVKVGEIYKYKELCELMGTEEKSGCSKKAQLKQWKGLFDWTNPTSQKFLITEVYDNPRKVNTNWGGARVGSGRPEILSEEFDVMMNAFIRNKMSPKSKKNIIYFTKNEIFKFFGIYNNIYALKKDKYFNCFFNVFYQKTSEIGRSWVIDKIKNSNKYEFGYTVEVTLLNDRKLTVEYRDDLVKEWKKHRNKYLARHGYTLGIVVRLGKWDEMLEYIDSFFPKYLHTRMVCKVVFEDVKDTLDDVSEMRKRYNSASQERMLVYFEKKNKDDANFEIEDYKFVLQDYIDLNGTAGNYKYVSEHEGIVIINNIVYNADNDYSNWSSVDGI